MPCCDRPADSEIDAREDLNPIKSRKCRDVLWLLIFILGGIGSVIVASEAVREGDLDRLRYGISSNSTLCGQGVESGKSKLVFCFNATATADLFDGDLSIDSNLIFKVCADTCPTKGSNLVDIYTDKADEFVQATNIPKSDWEFDNHRLVKTLCVAPSVSVLNRCVLDLTVNNATLFDILYDFGASPADTLLGENSQMFINAYNDIYRTWYIIVICGLAGGAVIAFAALQALRFFGAPIVWTSLFFFICLIIVINAMIAIKAGYADNEDVPEGLQGRFPTHLDVEDEYTKYWRYVFWIVAAMSVILFLVLGFMVNRIRLAIALIKEAAAVMRWVPQLVLTPILPAITLTAAVAYLLVIGAYLASAGEIREGELKWDRELRYAMIYHFSYGLWVCVFVLGFHSVTMAGVVASYYWSRDKSHLQNYPVTKSVGRNIRYHLGSIAMGSFVLTVVKVVKWALVYMSRKTKKYLGNENKVIKCVLCCVAYIVNCVEKFIKFLTKNAYIMIAVDGHSFCYSAGQAWKLIMANVARMTAVNLVSLYLFFIAKVSVGLMCAAFTTLWIDHVLVYDEGEEPVGSSFAPAVCAFLLGYFIAFLFFEVVDFTVDTLLLSFCLDDMRNGSTGNYYASTRLQKFMATAPKRKKEEAE